MSEEQLHKRHRTRLKERFLKQGIDAFEDHNVLELLLFYSVPQKDTNPIAHRLMERYGSLSAVFDAPYEDLLQVPGVGEHTATLIKLAPQLARRYCTDRFTVDRARPDHKEIGTFFVSHFLDRTEESVYGLFYSASLELIDSGELFSGSLHSAAFSVRDVAKRALLKNATYVILAHNHPGGIPIASTSDLDATHTMRITLAEMQIELIDHFIVAEGRYFSLSKERFDACVARVFDRE